MKVDIAVVMPMGTGKTSTLQILRSIGIEADESDSAQPGEDEPFGRKLRAMRREAMETDNWDKYNKVWNQALKSMFGDATLQVYFDHSLAFLDWIDAEVKTKMLVLPPDITQWAVGLNLRSQGHTDTEEQMVEILQLGTHNLMGAFASQDDFDVVVREHPAAIWETILDHLTD